MCCKRRVERKTADHKHESSRLIRQREAMGDERGIREQLGVSSKQAGHPSHTSQPTTVEQRSVLTRRALQASSLAVSGT